MSTLKSWSILRRFRSERPAEAYSNKKRGETFVAALEQAEQLFAASEHVTTATSPILLFYGISQLGRALAAASPRLGNSEFMLKGHGLISPEESWSLKRSEDITVKSNVSKNQGAFQRVAHVLQSCAIEHGERRLEDLLNLVSYTDPEQNIDVDVKALELPPLILTVPRSKTGNIALHQGPQPLTAELIGVPRSILPHRAVANIDETLEHCSVGNGHTGRERLANYLEKYPTLKNAEILTSDSKSLLNWRYMGPGHVLMQFLISLPLEPGEFSYPIPKRYKAYGADVVLACTDGCGKADHPFTIWWALLFSLSMVARYAPREWREMIDVDSSAGAVRLEQALEAARSTIPKLAGEVIQAMK